MAFLLSILFAIIAIALDDPFGAMCVAGWFAGILILSAVLPRF